MSEFEKGDHVTWSSHGGQAEGVVEDEITSDTKAAGRTVRASEDDPSISSGAGSPAARQCTGPAR